MIYTGYLENNQVGGMPLVPVSVEITDNESGRPMPEGTATLRIYDYNTEVMVHIVGLHDELKRLQKRVKELEELYG